MRRGFPFPHSQNLSTASFSVIIGLQRSPFHSGFQTTVMYTFLVPFPSVFILSDNYYLSLPTIIPIYRESCPRVLVQCTAANIIFVLITFKEGAANDSIRLAHTIHIY
jgi:hypothetical protein